MVPDPLVSSYIQWRRLVDEATNIHNRVTTIVMIIIMIIVVNIDPRVARRLLLLWYTDQNTKHSIKCSVHNIYDINTFRHRKRWHVVDNSKKVSAGFVYHTILCLHIYMCCKRTTDISFFTTTTTTTRMKISMS